ncbi:MAG: hypothetical protein AB8B69_08020 [Chitinophagales bacterium]
MKKLILWTLLVGMSMGVNVFAQVTGSVGFLTGTNKLTGENKLIGEYEPIRDKASAVSNIQKLQKGALLVRLKTRKKTIDAFKNSGYLKMADQVEMKQKAKNQKLMNAFRKNFSFCEVYFFYSEDSEKIMEGEYEGIFLNENLEKDARIVLKEDFILTAEVGSIVKDPVSVDASGNEYAATSGMSESVLIIKDSNFEQLRRPFPYYVKAGDRFIDKKVAKLNKRLFAFAGIR